MNWKSTNESLPPDGQVVHTKIDNADGCRNEQLLKRVGNLWHFPDDSMYVYYRPTHWCEMSESEREVFIAEQRLAEAKRHQRRMESIESY